MNKRINILVLIIFLFVLISSVTIGYSAFNTSLSISGDAVVRRNADVRITNLEMVDKTNGGMETYNSEYSRNLTTMSVLLPNADSTVTYGVTVTNNSSYQFTPNEIVEVINSNKNVKYEITGIKSYGVYEGNSLSFFIEFSTSLANQRTNVTIKYDFQTITKTVWDLGYTGGEQTFKVPYKSRYKLEVWGSQGGNSASNPQNYGGYAVGSIDLNKDQMLYVNVGGVGLKCITSDCSLSGGYNGGGYAKFENQPSDGGGGATHIATKSGLLSTLSNNLDDILIVAGGGGGTGENGKAGAGGGFLGGSGTDGSIYGMSYSGTGGSQSEGGRSFWNASNSSNIFSGFGQGGQYSEFIECCGQSGGGGGYFGGGASSRGHGGAGGGSGYIGNSLLFNKEMYGFNVDESPQYSTKTVSTTNYSAEPISKYAKSGVGHARITLNTTADEDTSPSSLIRISDIQLLSVAGSATEVKKSTYTDDSTSVYLNLPNSSSTATYLITITNDTEWYFAISKITEALKSNSNVSYSIENLNIDSVYQGNTYQFKLIVRTSSSALNVSLSLKYNIDMVDSSFVTFYYLGSEQTFVTPYNAKYKFELWGASGSRNGLGDSAGRGAYTSGYLNVAKGKTFYIYVGGSGSYKPLTSRDGAVLSGSYNGGGGGESTAGGATDVRLVNGEWNNFDSLKSRIMVAAGGGGSAYTNTTFQQRGDGGALNGIDAKFVYASTTDYSGHGASQTAGGKPGTKYSGNIDPVETASMTGRFGYGGYSLYAYKTEPEFAASGGGGGYYGGGHGNHPGGSWGGGGGGSSFISGYTGCNAISKSSTESNIIHTNSPNHYSGYVFDDPVMIAGNSSMPNKNGKGSITGNTEVGFAKITIVPCN